MTFRPILHPTRRWLFATVVSLSLSGGLITQAQTATDKAPAAQSEDLFTMNPFEVNADSDRGYLSNESISASRTNTPVGDIPQSIFVVTEELINDLAGNTLNDILRYVPGVDNNENNSEAVNIRGMVVGVALQDGFRYPRSFPSSQANIERTEILLGPAAVLYGNVFGTGGVINRITAKPKFAPQSSLKVQVKDQEDTISVTANTTGPIGNSDKFAYRLIANFQESEYLQDFTYLDRFSVMPSLLFQISDTSSLNFAAEYTSQSVSGGASSRTDYFLNGEIIEMPDNVNPEGGLGGQDIEKFGAQFAFVTKPLDHWTFRLAGLGYWSDNHTLQIPLSARLNADGHTISRRQGGNMRIADRGVGNLFFNADAAGDYQFGNVHFKTVFGLEYSYDTDGSQQFRANTALPNFDFFAPDYTTVLPTSFTETNNQRVNTFQYSGFGTGVLEFFDRKVLVSGGLRLTDFTQTTHPSPGAEPITLEGDSHTVPRYGILYKALPNFSIFYSYSESYQVVTNVNPDGTLLEPIAGQQDEIGLKGSFFNGRINYTAGVYILDQINTPQSDPDRPGYQLSSGAQRSEGFDISLVASVVDGLQAILGFSHVKTEILEDANPANVGLSRSGSPPNSASAWLRYSVRAPKLRGLSLALGTIWKDDNPIYTAASPDPVVFIPGYTTYDAMVSYNLRRRIKFQLNIRNITDERYYPNGNQNNLTVGEPRTYTLTTSYTF